VYDSFRLRRARLIRYIQLQFFSLLVPAGLVSARSLLEVYRSLLAVLNEVGGGGHRADRALRAVGEGLMRVSYTLVLQ
jgi:nuclear cap-binding protein subunit 1